MTLQSLAMAALIGGTFWQIGTGQESRAKRLPVLFFCTVGAWLACHMAERPAQAAPLCLSQPVMHRNRPVRLAVLVLFMGIPYCR